MKALDYYEIEIKAQDKIIDLEIGDFSFSISDSIYSLLNTASLTINDSTGLFQEYMLTTKGSKFDIKFGLDRNYVKGSFVNIKDTLDTITTPGIISGEVDLGLVNYWFWQQSKKSNAYRDSISSIINKIVTPIFREKKIDTTDNMGTFYQPLKTDIEFIEDILLPNAYSQNAEDTPFFAFIGNDGIFYFQNAKTIFNNSISMEIDFRRGLVIGEASNSDILSIKRIKNVEENLIPSFYTKVFSLDKQNGNLVEVNKKFYDIINPKGRKSPILANSSNITNIIDVDFKDSDSALNNFQKARIIYSLRKSLFTETILVFLPFNPLLTAGKKVRANFLSSKKDDTSELSKFFTDNYIIINSEHIWNGQEKKGYTKCILGRKYVDIPDSYLLKGRTL